MRRIPVRVFGPDPITKAGVATQLRGRPEVQVVDAPEGDELTLACFEQLDEDAVTATRALQRSGCPSVILVLARVSEQDLMRSVDLGVAGVLRRNEATPERLADSIVVAARGEASLPTDLLGKLLRQVKEAQDSNGGNGLLHRSGLSHRETDVLRLVADGQDTREIATELCYSERTIKNIIQDVTRRFGLRNRSHAVAFALRQGLI